jgi:two-component system nitrogen regulation response regulator GlnG
VKSKEGFFTRADGGTLFLDEIGETPGNIQGMLLRTLAEGTVIPVGGSDERKVDVRIVAATDANIEEGGLDGTFRAALLHRLAGYEIRVPPLRERREDIPRLAVHFLETELEKIGETWRLIPQSMSRKLWFPCKLMLDLYRSDWPGNIRQLSNVIRQLVISSRGMEVLQVDDTVTRLFGAVPVLTKLRKKRATGSGRIVVNPDGTTAPQVDAEDLYKALVENEYEVAPAAQQLNMPRSSFYERLKRDPRFRIAKDILRAEIEEALGLSGGDIQAAARHLRISRRALLIRMRDFGIPT